MKRYRIYNAFGHWFINLTGRLADTCVFMDTCEKPARAVMRDLKRAGASPAQVQRVVGCELSNGEKP